MALLRNAKIFLHLVQVQSQKLTDALLLHGDILKGFPSEPSASGSDGKKDEQRREREVAAGGRERSKACEDAQEQGVSKLLRLDLNQMEEYLGITE